MELWDLASYLHFLLNVVDCLQDVDHVSRNAAKNEKMIIYDHINAIN